MLTTAHLVWPESSWESCIEAGSQNFLEHNSGIPTDYELTRYPHYATLLNWATPVFLEPRSWSEVFWEFTHWFFLKLSMVLGAHMVLPVADFLKKIFLPKKCGKWAKKWTQNRFIKFIGKSSHYFFRNMAYNESLYLLCPCTNPIFGANLVSEIWVKIF